MVHAGEATLLLAPFHGILKSMKYRSIFLCLLLLVLTGCKSPPNRIQWLQLDTALLRQQETLKPILFYFRSNRDVYALMMEYNTFGDEEVEARIKRDFLPVLIDIRQPGTRDLPSGRRLAEAFHIRSTPAIVLVDSEHQQLDSRVGFITVRTLLDMLTRHREPVAVTQPVNEPGNTETP